MARVVIRSTVVGDGGARIEGRRSTGHEPDEADLARIIALVAAYEGLDTREILSMRRHADIVEARQIAMWISRRTTWCSLQSIARAFGDRHHTTVMYGIANIETRMGADAAFAARVAALAMRATSMARRG